MTSNSRASLVLRDENKPNQLAEQRNTLMLGGDNELITQDCDKCERVEIAPYDSPDHRAFSLPVGRRISVLTEKLPL